MVEGQPQPDGIVGIAGNQQPSAPIQQHQAGSQPRAHACDESLSLRRVGPQAGLIARHLDYQTGLAHQLIREAGQHHLSFKQIDQRDPDQRHDNEQGDQVAEDEASAQRAEHQTSRGSSL